MFEGLRLNHWKSQIRDDGYLLLFLDRKDSAVNALHSDILDEFGQMLERIELEPPKGIVVASSKSAGFIPGADIKSFEQIDARGETYDFLRKGQLLFDRFSRLPCPTVAAIHGHCMGGGTELALACNFRVASNADNTKIGLPEIKLGIFPGWGGSVRAPRLIGPAAALDLMLSGRALRAQQAKKLGLVDKLCLPDELIETSIKTLQRRPKRSVVTTAKHSVMNSWPVRQLLANLVTKTVRRKARKSHYPAPYALIDCWRRYGGSNISRALIAEAKAVAKLAQTPTARNLVRVFLLMERVKSLGGKEHGIQNVHVIGAGVMGGDIAAWCALKGFHVSLQDRELKYIQPALDRAEKLFERKVKDPDKRREVQARLRADVDGIHVSQADLIIEAIFENLEAKKTLFTNLEPKMKHGAILVSNTSSISLSKLSQDLIAPPRFAGLHYFNPVALMPLVEIVRHDSLSSETEQRLAAFCRSIEKLPVPVAGTPGFLVNRILAPFMQEAVRCLQEGIPGSVIDKAALEFGMPMGPIELVDTVGHDVAVSVGKIMSEFHGVPVQEGFTLQENKRGKKDGEGFYKWENGRAVKPKPPKSYKAPGDLQDRLILPMINEAVSCLHDGTVADADLLDAGVIFGTGFAPFLGGPINYVKSVGAVVLRDRLQQLQEKHGDRFAARPGWDALK